MLQLDGQLSIFDWLIPQKVFCEDERINIILSKIEENFEKVKDRFPKLKSCSKEYITWSHVPQYGKRLELWYSFDCKFKNIPEVYCGVGASTIAKLLRMDELIKNAADMDIELSISPTPSSMMICTTYNRKEDRKRFK